MNVVFVDWSKGGKTFPFYDVAKLNTLATADIVTKVLEFLTKERNVDYDKITVVGFSLGGNMRTFEF